MAKWAMEKSVSFHDAIYLFVAESIGEIFRTADRKLYEFFIPWGNSPKVRRIVSYEAEEVIAQSSG